MFAFKKKYFLIIESIKDLDLRNIKIHNKFNVIYRNFKKSENIDDIKKFRKQCKLKQIKFFIANDTKLAISVKADGLYVSAFNKNLKSLHYKKSNFSIIGSAHSMKEIKLKILQGCNYILLSKLFKVDYDNKAPHLGIIKFNIFCNKISKNLVALGGIKIEKLNYLKDINCKSVAILSELKKKPANIVNRLF
tara:strand:- start:700 stop:1275 length:576 start_codon:yes stop_codon:yes gene_type:complete